MDVLDLTTPEAVRKAKLPFSGFTVESAEGTPINYSINLDKLDGILTSMANAGPMVVKNLKIIEGLGVFDDQIVMPMVERLDPHEVLENRLFRWLGRSKRSRS
jgi:hypothetical protein